MEVRCVLNKPSLIENNSIRAYISEYLRVDELNIELGKKYLVLGLISRKGIPWYLIMEDRYDDYPVPHCSVFFEVRDNSLPDNWFFAENGNIGEYSFLPRVWAEKPDYMEQLMDGNHEAVNELRDILKSY